MENFVIGAVAGAVMSAVVVVNIWVVPDEDNYKDGYCKALDAVYEPSDNSDICIKGDRIIYTFE